ncbi:ABC transporter ATP-binding protein [Streptomyces sp. RB6PN25]|uniref:ABC transporter ATP-binding protein n=1 Tax=Streptomyces humicola TaxID=2953240 RepID=A0ABT1PTB1_9ACTN|nr:ABC transporter ATP-binding protein [Streptomyces humicola]MCQ4080185.1 ABC transporter ATP-binding protein [Streptomyces humicola]
MAPLLEVSNLSTHIQLSRSTVRAVEDVSFHLEAGETLGLVGESGCGKSMTGLSLMGLLPPGGRLLDESSIRLDGRELVGLPDSELRKIRGNEIAMVFQDPMSSLDPTKTIGYQVAEPVRLHRGADKAQALERATEVLALVGLPRPKERLNDYPHHLSGGLRQRVMIAMALACEPKVLIADEPTTALDVTIQAQILTLLADLKDRLGMAMILITHDMGVVAGHADRINVMYAGRIAETTETGKLFSEMRHPYTQGLLASIPRLAQDNAQKLYTVPGLPPDLSDPPAGCRFAARCTYATDRCREEEPELVGSEEDHRFACWHPVDGPLDLTVPTVASAPSEDEAEADAQAEPATETDAEPEADPAAAPVATVTTRAQPEPASHPLLEVTDLAKEFPIASGLFRRSQLSLKAVSGVSLTLGPGQTFGLVGESGCGKTTLGRMIVGLEKPTSGTVTLEGREIASMRERELRRFRRDLQMMFQDPYSSLDPRMRVEAILREPLRIQGMGSGKEQLDRVTELLGEVGLPKSALERFPHEFSGGQRQRIGLARALTLNPKVIVADEPVSALDVSIRAQVLNLMKRLQAAHDLSYVVISHDLAVVKYLADRIGVMYLGKMVELGSGQDIYERPAHPYTAGLLEAIPVPEPEVERGKRGGGIKGELPSPVDPPSGCRFRTRCPFAQEQCAVEEPKMRVFGDGHVAACHFPLQAPVVDAKPSAPTAESAGTSGGEAAAAR